MSERGTMTMPQINLDEIWFSIERIEWEHGIALRSIKDIYSSYEADDEFSVANADKLWDQLKEIKYWVEHAQEEMRRGGYNGNGNRKK